jgi:hypothetical protein
MNATEMISKSGKRADQLKGCGIALMVPVGLGIISGLEWC